MAATEEVVKVIDARFAWLRSRLLSSLRCKEPTLDRLFSNEDSAAAISSFVDSGEVNRLLVYDAGKGELAAVRSLSGRGSGSGSAALSGAGWLHASAPPKPSRLTAPLRPRSPLCRRAS
jgi:hypothetical protein